MAIASFVSMRAICALRRAAMRRAKRHAERLPAHSAGAREAMAICEFLKRRARARMARRRATAAKRRCPKLSADFSSAPAREAYARRRPRGKMIREAEGLPWSAKRRPTPPPCAKRPRSGQRATAEAREREDDTKASLDDAELASPSISTRYE